MLESLDLIQVLDRYTVGITTKTIPTLILVPVMADRYMITSWIVNFGVRFGEKHGPISLYNVPWTVL
jgi:hypothetical protein